SPQGRVRGSALNFVEKGDTRGEGFLSCAAGRNGSPLELLLEPEALVVVLEGAVALHGALVGILPDEGAAGIVFPKDHGDAGVHRPVAGVLVQGGVGHDAGIRHREGLHQLDGAGVLVDAVDVGIAVVPFSAVQVGAHPIGQVGVVAVPGGQGPVVVVEHPQVAHALLVAGGPGHAVLAVLPGEIVHRGQAVVLIAGALPEGGVAAQPADAGLAVDVFRRDGGGRLPGGDHQAVGVGQVLDGVQVDPV